MSMAFALRNLLHFLQNLRKNTDSGKTAFALFWYFRKAFDCVNREILLLKLNTNGMRGIA